jgi:glutathione-regulated potassium-efflux system ancillary protein KefF
MSSDTQILVVYAHPSPRRSPLHRALAGAARAMPGVELRDLYQTYPDFYIDPADERKLVEAAKLLVFLHPMRWYSMPSLLKLWVEVVFEPSWAYARNRGALKNKDFWLVTSTGSGPDAYTPQGLHGRPFGDFLAPFEQTVALCGMRWNPPLVMQGASRLDDAALDARVASFRAGLEGFLQTGAVQASPNPAPLENDDGKQSPA